MNQYSIDDWYTAGEAAKVMTAKNKRVVKAEYLRSLARLGKITTKKIGERTTLYLKKDVDAYVVEDRGEKAARAKKALASKKEKPAT